MFLVDETPACIGRFSKYCTRFFHVPEMKQENGLIAFLKRLAEREDIKGWVVFPTHDATVETLYRNKDQLGETFRVTVPIWSTTEFAYNKIRTHQLSMKTGVPVAETIYPKNMEELQKIGQTIKYPVILKPAVMHTFYARFKTKLFKADNLNELKALYRKACSAIDPSEVMIQEIIPGFAKDLYSCGCFFREGRLQASCIGQRRRQIPMDFGKATTFVQSVDIHHFRHCTKKLLSEIDYYGLAEMEFMQDPRDDVFKLLEINPKYFGPNLIVRERIISQQSWSQKNP